MIVKNVWYNDNRCICSFKDSNLQISFPISDDPGIFTKDEIIITNSMIWKLIRYEQKPSFYIDDDDDDDYCSLDFDSSDL